MVDYKDRRRHARKRVDLEVAFVTADGDKLVGHGNDMSMGGMFVETAWRAPFGAKVSLSFKIPSSSAVIAVEALVRWTTPAGMGVQFQLLGARDTYAITEYLAKCESIS